MDVNLELKQQIDRRWAWLRTSYNLLWISTFEFAPSARCLHVVTGLNTRPFVGSRGKIGLSEWNSRSNRVWLTGWWRCIDRLVPCAIQGQERVNENCQKCQRTEGENLRTVTIIRNIPSPLMLTKVFQLIGSTKPFTTSATSSALTFALPTTAGSRFIHISHLAHCWIIAGTTLSWQRLFRYWREHMAIPSAISDLRLSNYELIINLWFLTLRVL